MGKLVATVAIMTIVCLGAFAQEGKLKPAPPHEEVAEGCADRVAKLKLAQRTAGFDRAVTDDLRKLQQSAEVLATHDREDACDALLGSIESMIDEHREQLREREIREELRAAPMLSELAQGVAASDLIGLDVVNLRDDDLGEIDEVIINPKRGSVGYLVLSHGGIAGLGSRRVQVPWSELRLVMDDGEPEYLVLAADEEVLKQRPELESDVWPIALTERWPGSK